MLTTPVICGLIFLFIIAWDIYLYLDDKPRNSISQVIIDMSAKQPTLPWFIGFVMGWCVGHWWG